MRALLVCFFAFAFVLIVYRAYAVARHMLSLIRARGIFKLVAFTIALRVPLVLLHMAVMSQSNMASDDEMSQVSRAFSAGGRCRLGPDALLVRHMSARGDSMEKVWGELYTCEPAHLRKLWQSPARRCSCHAASGPGSFSDRCDTLRVSAATRHLI